MKIWERYCFFEVLKVFTLFLGSFYFLYVLIDYANHTQDFSKAGLPISHVFFYYLCHFFKRLEVIAPFALMLACIRTLCSMNINREIVALTASGLRQKRLLVPFLMIGFLLVGLMYTNYEFLLPKSQKALRNLNDKYFNASRQRRDGGIQSFKLKSGQSILYESYDSARERFRDVYWIAGIDDIYHMKYLYPDSTSSRASFVDHLSRSTEDRLVLVESYPSRVFEQLGFDDDVLSEALQKADTLPMSQLWKLLPEKEGRMLTDKEVQVIVTFHAKLALPWLSLLVVLGTAPFCIGYTRSLHVFLIYGLSIFAFITFFTLFRASEVLGESLIVAPALACWGPVVLAFATVAYPFWRVE